jgi:hypothetical protein
VKKVFINRNLMGISSMFLALALTGCGTTPSKDFGGPWKPVNQFQLAPTAIPLNQTYIYFASPMDGTLKTMLARWASDSGLTLSYQLSSDFTLFTPVSRVHTSDIRAAAAQLSSIYAQQGLSVTVTDRQILVGPTSAITPDPTVTRPAAGALKPVASPGPHA